jgi:hypothetical protein
MACNLKATALNISHLSEPRYTRNTKNNSLVKPRPTRKALEINSVILSAIRNRMLRLEKYELLSSLQSQETGSMCGFRNGRSSSGNKSISK